ncbi:hypothetical protein DMH04_50245 [Kibdelosporangium aridum]|uniref:Uncharacterized protein n=1 Tax=Kibdelosporangium aridum TaxID=2030 RepID=A0A428YBL4_KIBAR|nr:hypothetical protein [Kibdelosporangium aridum]RSM64951.1 hypothetical protein DMH04_50245 [Kibdelosporangium aridum]
MNRSSKQAALVLLGIFMAGALAAVIVLVTHESDGTSPIAFTNSPPPPTSFTASVTMTISLGRYSSCESGGYRDIRSGGQVEIVNQKHEVLALGTLTRSTLASCEFMATVANIPFGERMYGAKLGNANRGIIWKTESEARSTGWSLTLGE